MELGGDSSTDAGCKKVDLLFVIDNSGSMADEQINLVSSFPVEDEDQIMLITDGGQTIRLPVGGDKPIRMVSRGSQGVIVFDTAEGEKVVSVEHISEPEEDPDVPEAPVVPVVE